MAFAAATHTAELSHGFFGRLGTRFLSAYYDSFIRSPYSVGLIAHVDDRPCGVLVGTCDNQEHYPWVIRHYGVTLGWAGFAALCVRPEELRLFVRTRVLRYLRAVARLAKRSPVAAPTAGSVGANGKVAVLTHLCVTARAKGLGAGTALVDEFLRLAKAADAGRAELVTLDDERGAGAFYVKSGWLRSARHQGHDGQPFSVYVRSLS